MHFNRIRILRPITIKTDKFFIDGFLFSFTFSCIGAVSTAFLTNFYTCFLLVPIFICSDNSLKLEYLKVASRRVNRRNLKFINLTCTKVGVSVRIKLECGR
jgi:hypothetical protein